MVDFFESPWEVNALQRERLRRQQNFTRQRTQAQRNPAAAERLLEADRRAPAASNQLKETYAHTPMSFDQLDDLVGREASRGDHDPQGVGERVGSFLRGIGMGAYDQIIKPAVRGAFTLFDGAYEELVHRPLTASTSAEGNLLTNPGAWREAYDQYGDSPLRNHLQGDRGQAPAEEGTFGHGFFPGGQYGARTEEENTLETRGERATFGRNVTNSFIGNWYGPGDAVYDKTAMVIDITSAIVLDPTALATGGATKVISAAKGIPTARTLGEARRAVSIDDANDFVNHGLIQGRRTTALPEAVEHLFGNTRILDELAGLSEYQIMQRLRASRVAAREDDLAEFITRLGDAKDADSVGEVLIDAARRGQVRERGFYAGHGKFVPNVRETFRDMRLNPESILYGASEFRYGGKQPARAASSENRMQAAEDIDDILRLGKVPEAERASIVGRALRSEDNETLFNVVSDSTRAIARKMEDVGVAPERIDELLENQRKQMNETTSYLVDEAGRPSAPPWGSGQRKVTIHGVEEEVTVPTASMIAHFNKGAIPLPDAKEVRHVTAKYEGLRKVYDSAGWEMTDTVLRKANSVWKYAMLFSRFAYPLRNGLDNQARMSAAGFHSAFTSPDRWISMGVRNPDKFRDIALDATAELGQGRGFYSGAGTYGIIDELDEAAGTARVRIKHLDDPEEVRDVTIDELREMAISTSKTVDEFATEMGALTADAAGMWVDDGTRAAGAWRTYARGIDGDDEFVTAWRHQLGHFTNDPIARRLADDRWLDRDELIDSIIDDGLAEKLAQLGGKAEEFLRPGGAPISRSSVDEYLTHLDENIRNITGGNPELRRLIATGELNGIRFNDLTQNKQINRVLREQHLETSAPQYVSGDTFVKDPNKAMAGAKKFFDSWAYKIGSMPENKFTRFPLLAQLLADDWARMMPSLADDGLRTQLVKRAADAGFDDELFPQIAQAAQRAAGQKGALDNLTDLVEASKLHATDRMLDIAFDASHRSSLQTMADVIMPFYDAFAEVGRSWGRILRDNPAALSRGVQAYTGARDAGIFFTNERGEEMFQYPGGGLLAKALGIEGGQAVLPGRVEGLNLVTQGIGPGFGPLIQWGVGAFTPDTPDFQWIRDFANPYGSEVESPADLASPGKLAKDALPAWWNKAMTAWTNGEYDEAAFNSAAGDVMSVLATTGAYDTTSDAGRAKLVEDAEKGARLVTLVRSLIQQGMPTGAQVEWEIDTDQGAMNLQALASDYYKWSQESDPQTAAMTFIEMYGVEPYWIAQGKTQETTEGPRTTEGWNWMQRHEEAWERNPDVMGYFVPAEDPDDQGDHGIFLERLRRGDVESIGAGIQFGLAEQRRARQMMYAFKERTKDLPYQQRVRLEGDFRTMLEEQHPGWQDPVPGTRNRLERDRLIEKLEAATQDPDLQDSPVTEPLTIYLTARQRVMGALAERKAAGEASTLEADANQDLRLWLHDIGQQVNAQDPHFQGVWRSVLSSEVE